jgi:hypothetical protein
MVLTMQTDLTHRGRIVPKPWGHEIIWAHTERYVGKILHINKGESLSYQYHVVKDETIRIATSWKCQLQSSTTWFAWRTVTVGPTRHLKNNRPARLSNQKRRLTTKGTKITRFFFRRRERRRIKEGFRIGYSRREP